MSLAEPPDSDRRAFLARLRMLHEALDFVAAFAALKGLSERDLLRLQLVIEELFTKSFESSILEWLDAAVPSDASITAGSPVLDRKHMPFASSVLERLEDTPGLAGYNPLRTITTEVSGAFAAGNVARAVTVPFRMVR